MESLDGEWYRVTVTWGGYDRMRWTINEDKIPSREDVKRMVKSARERSEAALAGGRRQAVVDWAVLHTLLGTGLRSHELAALRVGDLRIGHGEASVSVREGKGGKPRMVAISSRLKAHLRAFLAWKGRQGEAAMPDSVVFLSERGAYTTRGLRHLFKRCQRQAGLENRYGLHALRHFHLSMLYQTTTDLRMVQEQAGHASVSTTQVYTHVSLERRRQAVERIF